jgi:hypothetical protein
VDEGSNYRSKNELSISVHDLLSAVLSFFPVANTKSTGLRICIDFQSDHYMQVFAIKPGHEAGSRFDLGEYREHLIDESLKSPHHSFLYGHLQQQAQGANSDSYKMSWNSILSKLHHKYCLILNEGNKAENMILGFGFSI